MRRCINFYMKEGKKKKNLSEKNITKSEYFHGLDNKVKLKNTKLLRSSFEKRSLLKSSSSQESGSKPKHSDSKVKKTVKNKTNRTMSCTRHGL